MSGLTLHTQVPGTVGKPDNSGSVPVGNKVRTPPPGPGLTLERLQQRFPNEPVEVLKGMYAHVDMSEQLKDTLAQVRAQAPRRGQVAVLVGTGKDARVALLPTTGVKGPNREMKVRDYVRQGKEIFDQVMTGDPMPAPDKRNVAKLMWYLQAMGSAKAAESSGHTNPALYREGAFSVEDRDGCLQAFLQSANSYQRLSSHMKDYQRLGDEFQPRGLDLRNVETPNERKTILFAPLPQDQQIPEGSPLMGTGDKRMLFIKMEPNGCRGLTPKGSGTPREEGMPPNKWKAFKRFFLNFKDLVAHGLGFAQSVGQRMGIVAVAGQDNRERIPSGVKRMFENGVNRVTNYNFPPNIPNWQAAQIRHVVLRDLQRANPLSDSAGIKQMLANLNAAIASCRGYNLPAGALMGLANELSTLAANIRSHRDHPDMRIGNEIILTRDETPPGPLSYSATVKPFTPGVPLEDKGGLSPEGREILEASLQYGLDSGFHMDSRVEAFQADTNRCQYTIGRTGHTQTFPHDTEGVTEAVLKLTGNDTRVATALMSLANQSLAADITVALSNHSLSVSGIMISIPATQGATFGVERLPDEGSGEGRKAVYEVSFSSLSHPEQVVKTMGTELQPIPLDPNQSVLTSETRVRLTVSSNGEMKVALAGPPSFHYRLTST